MKKFFKKSILTYVVLCISICFQSLTFAAGNDTDCNRFWAKCHVESIHTLHTDDAAASSSLLDTFKNAINRCLWILATVVLCFCMYWWFKMLTSGSDSKWYDDGWKVLKNALFWLAIILLAWMIVSVVFRFVGTLSGWNQTQSVDVI